MRFYLLTFIGIFVVCFSFNKKYFSENIRLLHADPATEECLTDHLLQQKLNSDLAFKSRHEELENKASKFFRNQSLSNGGQLKMDYTLPLVFHIVHQNGLENISDADVQFAVEQLNDAFANINFYDQGVGVDTRLDFCLAKRDPAGNATTGINRVVSPLTNMNTSQDLQLKDLSRWDPLHYINIWLVNDIGGAAGYAYLPSSHGQPEDGIVMRAEIMTNLGGGHSTLVHELGHYLGLYHTFQGGCVNNDCLSDGDRVCDTPPDGSTAPPPSCMSVVNSCTTDTDSGLATDENDLYWNYVDYGNHICRAGYSQGQTDRMVYFIENVRQSLLESQACLDPCTNPFDASFTASAMTIDLGETVNFTNTSTGGNDFEWLVNGVSFSTANDASYIFDDGDGVFEITLIANNGDPNCTSEFSVNVVVLCPTEANFSASTLTTIAGETVDFFNNSVDANNYEWQVNGVTFSNNINAAYTFNNLGNYEVKLIATHPTGDCSDEFSLVIQVNCIATSFNVSNLYPTPGSTVAFANTTLGGQTYSWSVNNMPQGNSTDLNYLFSSPGVYNICLEASNGFCTDDYCQQIFVFEDTDGDCTSTFVKIIGEENEDEIGYSIIPSHDGHFYLSGSTGTRGSIIKIDVSGNPIWQRTFQLSNGRDVITEIILDSENNIVGSGYGYQANFNDYAAFAFKYDPINDNMVWTRRFSAHSRAWGILEPQPGGDYLVYLNNGSSTIGQNGVLIYLDPDTGNESGALDQQYNLGSSETFNAAILYNNELYVAGRYTNGNGSSRMRWSVSNFDLNGNEEWSRLSFNASSNSARLYARDIIEDNGALFSTGGGDDDGVSTTQTHVFLQKNTINGNLDWVRKYNILQYDNEWGEELVSTPDGFLIYGHNRENPGQLFLLKTDKDGAVMWAKSYGGAGHETNLFSIESNIMVAGNFIYFVSETSSFGGDQDIVLFRVDQEGNLQDDCMLVEDLDVTMTNVNNPANESVELIRSPAQLPSNAAQVDPEDLLTIAEDAPDCECDEFSGGCENSSFVKIIGEENEREIGTAIIPSGDGHLFVAGSSGTRSLITKIDVAGNYIWQRSFQFSLLRDIITEIFVDADGYLVGCGFGDDGSSNFMSSTAFVFKYDPVNDEVVWLRRFSPRSLAIGVLDPEPNGDYLVYMIALGNNTDGHLTKLDRNTGNITDLFSDYKSSATENFADVIAVNNGLYLIGRYTDGNNVAGYRFGLSRFDFDGNEIWSKLTFIPSSSPARLYPTGIVEENNALFTFGFGDDDGTSISVTDLFLQKSDLSGEPEWVMKYRLPGMTNEWADELVSVPDGFVLFGVDRNSPGQFFIIKTDKEGNVIWAKSYGGAGNEFSQSYYKSQLIAGSNFIYFVGSTDSYGGDEDILLVKTDGDGNVDDECIVVNDLEVVTSINNNPSSKTTSFYTTQPNIDIWTAQADSQEENIFSENVDGCECAPAIDTCANGAPINQVPDAVLQFANANCNGENQTVEFQICNNDSISLPISTPVSIYDNDPTLFNAQLIETVVLTDSISPGDCMIFNYELNIPFNQELFALVNDPGTTATPFNLSSNFSNAFVEECDFTNNINSFIIDFIPPSLDLGPDVTVCDFGVTDLDAGLGFATYFWSDASTGQMITAWQPGIYWVEATDSCGGVHVDSILLQVEPASIVEIGVDTVEICAGQSTSFSVTGFNSYQWLPSDHLDCDTCATVTASPDTTITYFLVAGEGNGCVSEDSVTVTMATVLMTYDTMSFCTGDTVLIFGNEITEAGNYSEMFSSVSGCDSLHTTTLTTATDTILLNNMMHICEGDSVEFFGNWLTSAGSYEYFDNSSSCVEHNQLDLIVNDTFFNADTIYLCSGDSVLIFGNYEMEEGVFTVVFPSVSGCDSTEQIRLFISDTIFTNEIIEICTNETADVFGLAINTPGIYTELYTTSSGCDSLHEIQLIVHDTFLISDTVYICSGDSVLVFGNYETEAGIYSDQLISIYGCDSTVTVLLEILDTFFTSEIQEICANEMVDVFGVPTNNPGIYSQTVPSVNGCDSTHAIEVIVHDTFFFESFLQICPGDSILIFGNYETEAGIYSESGQTVYGCDSNMVIHLEILEEIILEMESSPACPGTDVGSVAVNISSGVAPFNFNWSFPNAPNEATLSGVPPGEYSVTVTDANNCSALATAEVGALTEISMAINSGDVTCPDDSDGAAVIFVNIDDPSFSLDGINFQAVNVFENLSAGDYTVTVADLNTGCTAQETFTISGPPQVDINLPPDVTIELGDEINIASSSTQIISNYSWVPDLALNCNDCPEVVAQPETTVLYTLNVIDANGCPGADSILITVEFNPRIFIPNAFSPNGDGINDFFFPYSDGVADIKLMRIFNRWGGLVYEAAGFQPNDPVSGWDGTFKGKLLDPAVFAYFVQVIYADGTEDMLEGDVTLIR
ncbi:MAG: M43 family zinc metalloprotease [Bacteroidota bacterium]